MMSPLSRSTFVLVVAISLLTVLATFTLIPPSLLQPLFVSAQNITELMREREATVARLAAAIENQQLNRCACLASWTSTNKSSCVQPGCGNDYRYNEKFSCITNFGNDVKMCGGPGLMRSLNKSTTVFAPGTSLTTRSSKDLLEGSLCGLDFDQQAAIELRNTEALYGAQRAAGSWMGFVTEAGGARFYPGFPFNRTPSKCNNFDARLESWYQTASSGPRDIVLVIDTSGSMGWFDAPSPVNRITLTRQACIALLQQLTSNDFFGIVGFATTAYYAASALVGTERRLLRATPANVQIGITAINNLVPNGGTRFNTGFTLGFTLFRNSQDADSTCTCDNRVMLFLTDGVAEETQTAILNNIATLQSTVGTRKIKIFTVVLGTPATGAEYTKPRAVSCANEGVSSFVAPGTSPLEALSQYYRVLAYGFVQTNGFRWAPPNIDKFLIDSTGTSTKMVTVSKAIYDKTDPTKTIFIGAAVLVVPESLTNGTNVTTAQLEGNTTISSKECALGVPTTCLLQQLRNAAGYECPAPVISYAQCVATGQTYELQPCAGTKVLSGPNQMLCEPLTATNYVSIADGSAKTLPRVACCLSRSQTISGTRDDSASLSGTFGRSASLSQSPDHSASLSGTFQRSLTFSSTPDHSASLTGTPDLSATLSRRSKTGSHTSDRSATFSGTFAKSATLSLSPERSVSFSGTFAKSATLSITPDHSASLSGTADHSATLTRGSHTRSHTADHSASFSGTFGKSASFTLTEDDSASLSGTADQSATLSRGSRTRSQTSDNSASFSGSISRTVSRSWTPDHSASLSGTPDQSATLTRGSRTKSHTSDSTATFTGTADSSASLTGTASDTATETKTLPPTDTDTLSETGSESSTKSSSSTETLTRSQSESKSRTRTADSSASLSETVNISESLTSTPDRSESATISDSITETPEPTHSRSSSKSGTHDSSATFSRTGSTSRTVTITFSRSLSKTRTITYFSYTPIRTPSTSISLTGGSRTPTFHFFDTCSEGWIRFGLWCFKHFPPTSDLDIGQNTTVLTPMTFDDALKFCEEKGATILPIQHGAMLSFLEEQVVGKNSGRMFWNGVYQDTRFKSAQQVWRTVNNRTGFNDFFVWDTRRRMPQFDDCVVHHMKGDPQKRIVGGSDAMVTYPCNSRAEVVCARLREPWSVTSVNQTNQGSLIAVEGEYLTLSVVGRRLPRRMQVQLQTTSYETHSGAEGQPTHCVQTKPRNTIPLNGSYTPVIALNISRIYNFDRFCNGSCDRTIIRFPAPEKMGLQRGFKYSICFFFPYSYDNPLSGDEFKWDFLPNLYLEVHQSQRNFMAETCERRDHLINLLYFDNTATDAKRIAPSPWYFDGPLQPRDYWGRPGLT